MIWIASAAATLVIVVVFLGFLAVAAVAVSKLEEWLQTYPPRR